VIVRIELKGKGRPLAGLAVIVEVIAVDKSHVLIGLFEARIYL